MLLFTLFVPSYAVGAADSHKPVTLRIDQAQRLATEVID